MVNKRSHRNITYKRTRTGKSTKTRKRRTRVYGKGKSFYNMTNKEGIDYMSVANKRQKDALINSFGGISPWNKKKLERMFKDDWSFNYFNNLSTEKKANMAGIMMSAQEEAISNQRIGKDWVKVSSNAYKQL